MKKLITCLLALILMLSATVSAFAADGNVIYDGVAKEFIFQPGSDESPTDLFPDFKGVMPGDTLNQKILVKNDSDLGVKVKICIRSLGATEGSEEFLSQLTLRVKVADGEEEGYMFDAAADQKAGLEDWNYLGTLYSGGEVLLDAELLVPTSLSNEFQDLKGSLKWEFMVEEFPVEDDDPSTGDRTDLPLYLTLASVGLVGTVFFLILILKKNKKKENQA